MYLLAQRAAGLTVAFFACDACGNALEDLSTTKTFLGEGNGPFFEIINVHDGCADAYEGLEKLRTKDIWTDALHGFFGILGPFKLP